MSKKIIIKENKLIRDIGNAINNIVFKNINENTLQEQIVSEALIYSYDTSVVVRHLTSTFNLANGIKNYIKYDVQYDGYIEIKKTKNTCETILVVIPSNRNELLKEITLSMEKSCGWFLARQSPINIEGFNAWQYEKKFDNDATDEVVKKQYIYHLAPSSRLAKIVHVGLVPKRTTWDIYKLDNEHSFTDEQQNHYGWKTIDRVYFFLNKPTNDFIKNNTFNQKDVFTDNYTLLKIDVSKINKGTRFSYDVRSDNAVYTMCNIPPTAITIEN